MKEKRDYVGQQQPMVQSESDTRKSAGQFISRTFFSRSKPCGPGAKHSPDMSISSTREDAFGKSAAKPTMWRRKRCAPRKTTRSYRRHVSRVFMRLSPRLALRSQAAISAETSRENERATEVARKWGIDPLSVSVKDESVSWIHVCLSVLLQRLIRPLSWSWRPGAPRSWRAGRDVRPGAWTSPRTEPGSPGRWDTGSSGWSPGPSTPSRFTCTVKTHARCIQASLVHSGFGQKGWGGLFFLVRRNWKT